jgi:hypothetical protein
MRMAQSIIASLFSKICPCATTPSRSPPAFYLDDR